MRWDDVEAFCHVVQTGSFTEAARLLGRPKSSVSAAVARLEGAMRTRLLERTTRRLRATDAGEALVHEAGPAFRRLRAVGAEVLAQGASVSGTLRIAAPYEFAAHHLGAVACRMLQRYPELHIDIDVEHQQLDPMHTGHDLLFSHVDQRLPDSGLVGRRMFTLRRGLYAAPALLDAAGRPGDPDALARLPMLARPGESEWRFTDRQGREARVPVTPRMRSSNAEVRRQAAIGALGVARITASYCEQAVREGLLEPVLPEWTCAPLRVDAILPARRLMPPKVRVFLDLLEEVAADGDPPDPAAAVAAPPVRATPRPRGGDDRAALARPGDR